MLQPNDDFLWTRQRHEAERMGLHWDYRLVHGDKAYSFATKKELPEPGKMTVLFEQPVHTAHYALSPKVVIPTGQYGAGVTTLDWIRKAKVSPESTDDKFVIFTDNGETFLLKKAPGKYGDKAWLFRNLTGMYKTQNPYLEKTKELQKEAVEKETHNVRNAAVGAAGIGAMSGATQKVLGYHTVYHGTTKDVAEKIKKQGFDPKAGGTGAASIHEAFKAESAGKIHVTKSKLLAHLYAAKIMHRAHPMSRGMDNSAEGVWADIKNSKVVKARVPHAAWEKFKEDNHHKGGKETAATTTKKINPGFVAGGGGSKGAFGFVHKNHLKNYYRNAEGRARGLKGLAQMAIGMAAAGYAGKKIYDEHQ